MGKYILYSHAGSENHGCEALLRTSILTIKGVDAVYSGDVNADKKYGLEKLVKILPDKTEGFDNFVSKLVYLIKYHIKKTDKLYFRNLYRSFIRSIEPDGVYISIGGDNYCYHFSEWLEVLNSEINKRGAKSVLWGCSINEDELNNINVLQDLKRYSLITARESFTYDLLKRRIPETKIKYVPDTAFILPKVEEKLPDGFEEGNTIGLNVSPVATENAKAGEHLLDYVIELVDYIIDHTTYQIALIPHVVIEGNDDRKTLEIIRKKCKNPQRTVLIQDDNCMVIKGYISRCELFIGARTHATIAAYSTGVPTLVLGYSVKARGIAKDLFGTEENYVIPVQTIDSGNEIINGFCWIEEHKIEIEQHLKEIMPEYKEKILEGVTVLEDV